EQADNTNPEATIIELNFFIILNSPYKLFCYFYLSHHSIIFMLKYVTMEHVCPSIFKNHFYFGFLSRFQRYNVFLPLISSEGFFPSTDKTLNCVPWIWNGCFIPPILSLTFSISQVS